MSLHALGLFLTIIHSEYIKNDMLRLVTCD